MGVLDTIRFLPLLLDNQSYTKYLCILNQKLANSSQAKLSSFSLDKRAKGLASFFFFFFYQYDENLFFFGHYSSFTNKSRVVEFETFKIRQSTI